MFLERSLTNAAAINPTAGSLSISDSVSTANLADVYKFNLQQSSSFSLLTSGLSGDVNIAIVQDTNGDGKVTNQTEVLYQSVNPGLVAESLKIATLQGQSSINSGNYFVVVELGANTTAANYTIDLGATKSTLADILWRDSSRQEVGYWRFDGLQFLESRLIQDAIGAGWQLEAIGDFDGDRAEDILWRNSASQELVIWLMDPETAKFKAGSGLVKPKAGVVIPTNTAGNMYTNTGFQVAGIGDVNGDGKGDIIWRNEAAQNAVIWMMDGTQYIAGGAAGFRNSQTNAFTAAVVDQTWELVDTTRVNSDRNFDIVWRNRTSGQVVNWMMDGNVILPNQKNVVAMPLLGAAYEIEAVGDFNGDGLGDLLWRDNLGQTKMWLMQNGADNVYTQKTLSLQTPTGMVALPTVPIDWKMVGVEDFSGDGKTDIVWRNSGTGALALWNMNGEIVMQQSVSVANSLIDQNNSRQALGTASKADYVDFASPVLLAAGSDTGVSQSDWITKERRPELSGMADAGSTVSLFANNTLLIGQTKASATGAWSLVADSLDDGVYSLSTQVNTLGGGVIRQNVARKLTIDGTAPELTTGGLIDGVAWTPQDQLKAILKDMDPQAKVEYEIKNGTLKFSAVLDATLTNIDGTAKTGNLALKSLSDMGFLPQTDGSLSKRTEIALTVTDRAGNVQTQTLKGMTLNLSDLTDESYLGGQSNSGYVSGGTADKLTRPNGTWVPVATVGTTPNQALYIGQGGAWGYAQAGTGTGAGGNGIAVGTIGWVTVPASQYSPSTGTGGTSTPPLPPMPTLPTNIATSLEYIPALEVIFKTAIDVLSGHSATAAKKSVLQVAYDQLVSTGRVVKEYGLHDVMQSAFSGVYKSAYVAGGQLAQATAVQLGWKLAQDLAQSKVSTKLQSFEAPLLAALHGAIRSSGNTVTPAQEIELRGTIGNLAKTYARLNPLPEQSYILEGYQATSFLDRLWDWGKFHNTIDTTLSTGVGGVITDLKAQLQGQVNINSALQFVDRLIQASTRVETLHQTVDGASAFSGYPTYIKYGGFLRELTELGFEIARVNPTTTVGVNESSEWIENLLEFGGSETGIQLAAGGLAQVFNGFVLDRAGSSVGMTQMGQALDYLGRLIQAAEAVSDPNLDAQVLKANFLSHLTNLGGAYAGLNPRSASSNTTIDTFLEMLYRTTSIHLGSNALTTFLQGLSSPIQQISLLRFERNLLSTLPKVQQFQAGAKDISFVNEMIDTGKKYVLLQNTLNSENPVIIDDLSSFLSDIWTAQNSQNLTTVAYGIQNFLGQKNPITIAANGVPNLLSYNPYSLSQLKKDSQSWTLANNTQAGDSSSPYTRETLEFTNYYNYFLKRGYTLNGVQVMKPMNIPINWLYIQAMIATETSPGSDARKYDPMQVANSGDHALAGIRDGIGGTKYYVRAGLQRELKNVLPTPFSNGWDYSSYPSRNPDQRMNSRLSIEAGIGWLVSRASISDTNGYISGWTPNPKDGWREAIIAYNGGGDPEYWSKVERQYKQFAD
jgi:Bacterial Ig-like domain